MDKNSFMNNKELYEHAYFCEEKIDGMPIKNPVERAYEETEIVDNRLRKGLVDEFVVAWKAGRLKSENGEYKIQTANGDYLNGYGGHIIKSQLDEYLKKVKKIWVAKKLNNCSDFLEIYEVITKEANAPKNFGTVYIINLIFFLSKGEWPIYDKFAHKAVKAIYMEKAPWKVYVGEAPDKHNVNDVVNMYEEYIWLLEKVFGKKNIDRETDRALWVYGHAEA